VCVGWQSEAISGNQGTRRVRRMAIRGNQRQSEAIRGNQGTSRVRRMAASSSLRLVAPPPPPG
jgi:hypothetical protein